MKTHHANRSFPALAIICEEMCSPLPGTPSHSPGLRGFTEPRRALLATRERPRPALTKPVLAYAAARCPDVVAAAAAEGGRRASALTAVQPQAPLLGIVGKCHTMCYWRKICEKIEYLEIKKRYGLR